MASKAVARGTYREGGLLVMRCGVGGVLLLHGLTKLVAGPTVWDKLSIGLGIGRFSTLFGFAAALALAAGGLLLALGLLFRAACVLLAATMALAIYFRLRQHTPFVETSHALGAAAVFIGLMFVGPGRHSIDRR
jgi:putative oxidoreductase